MPPPSPQNKRGPYRKAHIVRHGTGWKYMRSIPRDLRDAFRGKKTWTKYLGGDRTAAETAAHGEDAKNGALIQRWRALTDSERALIIASGGIDAAKGDDPGLPFVRFVANLPLPTNDDDVSEDELAHGTLNILQARQHVADAAKKKEGVRKVAAKLDGVTADSKLLALVDLWEKVRRPRSPKAAQKTKLYMQRFVEIVGDLEPRQVTRAHVMKFREKLEEQKLTTSNITQHLDKVHTIFNVALSEGEMDVNPAYKVKARRDTRKLSDRRQDFTSAQMRTILEKASDEEREDYRWIIRLLAYHGARSGEVCQLRVDDITKLHGIDVFRIHDRHEGNRVKNAASIRDVPIHSMCMGIVDYARRIEIEHGSEAWLFPNLKPYRQSRAHEFQNYCSRVFLRETCGIKGRHLTMHSLRHSFRTMARELAMPRDISRAIMGHSMGSDDHGEYGSVPSLKLRARWIKKIDPLKD